MGSELANQLGHSLADCTYLAMAGRLDVRLVTADARFCEAAKSETDRVILLADVASLAA